MYVTEKQLFFWHFDFFLYQATYCIFFICLDNFAYTYLKEPFFISLFCSISKFTMEISENHFGDYLGIQV